MTAAMANRIGLLGGPVLARRFMYMLAVVAVAVMGTAHAAGPLRAEPESLERAAPELIERLRADPYNYFRFVNRTWIARVCDDLGSDLRDLPVVRLHGDAHVEQFALQQDAWGIDDFDDSARGPAVVDIVRFLGSIDLVARRRSWEKDRDMLFDRFVEGYKQGLIDPRYLPPPPDIVGRLRAQAPATDRKSVAAGGYGHEGGGRGDRSRCPHRAARAAGPYARVLSRDSCRLG